MTDQTPTCEQVRLLDGTPTLIRHGHGVDEPCPFGPRPDSRIDACQHPANALRDHADNPNRCRCSLCGVLLVDYGDGLGYMARPSTPRTEMSEG